MKLNLNRLLVAADKVVSLSIAKRLLTARRISVNGITMQHEEIDLDFGDEIQIGKAEPFLFTEELAQKVGA